MTSSDHARRPYTRCGSCACTACVTRRWPRCRLSSGQSPSPSCSAHPVPGLDSPKRLTGGVQTKDRRPLRQKATERNVKMLLSCQVVLERLRVVLKTVEQIVLCVSSVLVCRPSLFVVYLSSVLVNCSTTATVCILLYRPSLSVLTANN